MRAELICTGTELLLGQIVNSNARLFSQALAALGIDMYRITTVGDNRERIAAAIREASRTCDLILLNGGLGPTEDDQTREALVQELGIGEEVHPETLEKIRAYGVVRNLPPLARNDKVARVPAGAVVFPNRVGSAPGSACRADGRTYILTPGPPQELRAVLLEEIVPWLRETFGLGTEIRSRILRVVGIGESAAEEAVRDLIHSPNPTLAPTAKSGELHFRITAKADSPDEADRLIAGLEEAFRDRLGEHVYGIDHETLEGVVGDMLRRRNWRIACAESCTGGLLASTLTDVPGSSAYFDMSFVTYADAWKEKLLGVSGELLQKRGAVSPEVVAEMARGIRETAGADVGVAISGIAGPDGGSLEKPVGLVYTGVCAGGKTHTARHLFSGERADIKERSVKAALALVFRVLQEAEPGGR